MESANIHHHQLQDHLLGSSSSVVSLPSSYGVGNNIHLAWINPTSYMSTNGLNSDPNEALLNPRESRQQENILHISPQYSSMSPDLGFHWANIAESSQDLNLSRIKEEISSTYYLKYPDLLCSCPPSSNIDDSTFKIEPRNQQSNDVGKRFLLKSLSHGDFCSNSQSNGAINCGRGFGQTFPSLNFSNLSLTGLTNPGSLDVNLQALDLLNSSRFSGNFNLSLQNEIGLPRDGFSYGVDYLQQSYQTPLYNSNKNISAPSNGAAAETKRTSNKMEAKAVQNAPKRLRTEARASCPPFKVRKEKLGDRISALQQLVAPFGKTDTASVLMEAIGYIKFLQNQVETLSVPYMKSASRNKKGKVMKGGAVENENDESKGDLKTRGLCLVPLSFLSYITGNGGAPVWPPPHFGGATG